MSKAEFDKGEPGARPFQLTETQFKFAEAVSEGHNYSESARIAGYQGNDAALRSAGSRAAASPKVRAYLTAKAKADGGGVEELGDLRELQSIFWREARYSQNPQSKIAAGKVLLDIEQTQKQQVERDPMAALKKLAEKDAFHALYLGQTLGYPLRVGNFTLEWDGKQSNGEKVVLEKTYYVQAWRHRDGNGDPRTVGPDVRIVEAGPGGRGAGTSVSARPRTQANGAAGDGDGLGRADRGAGGAE